MTSPIKWTWTQTNSRRWYREAWCALVHEATKNQTWLGKWTTVVDTCIQVWDCCYNPSDRNLGNCDGGGKKWSSFGYILKVEPIEFGEELSVEYERKGWLQVLARNTGGECLHCLKRTRPWNIGVGGSVTGGWFGSIQFQVIIRLSRLVACEILEQRRKCQKFRLKVKVNDLLIHDDVLKQWSQDLKNLETC